MKNHLKFYLAVFLFTFLVSCNGQGQTYQQESNLQQAKNELANVIPTVEKVDTILAPNAPSRIVRRIRKDKEGNFLIAAFTDVILYDGESFSKLPKAKGFESFDAFDALEDSKGNIWIASTHYGVFRYNGRDYMHFTTDNGLAHNRTIDIHEDRGGNIWISTMGGVSCYDGKTFHNFTTRDGLTNNDVNRIMEDKTGKIWIGTRGDACVYDGKTFTTITGENGQPFNNIRYIIEDRQGNIWLGGGAGLWQYDGNVFTNYSQGFVGNIHEDKKGNIWALSERWTLTMYESIPSSIGMGTVTQIETSSPMLFGIGEDGEGNIWVGTGSGVLKYDGKVINYFIDG